MLDLYPNFDYSIRNTVVVLHFVKDEMLEVPTKCYWLKGEPSNKPTFPNVLSQSQ
jgi:hypothetical protein